MPDHDDRATSSDLDRLRTQPGDYEQPLDPVTDPPAISRVAWVGFLILLVVVAIGLWVWTRGVTPAPVTAAPNDTPAHAERAVASRGHRLGEPDPSRPALPELDGNVRPLPVALSRRPEPAALLTTDRRTLGRQDQLLASS